MRVRVARRGCCRSRARSWRRLEHGLQAHLTPRPISPRQRGSLVVYRAPLVHPRTCALRRRWTHRHTNVIGEPMRRAPAGPGSCAVVPTALVGARARALDRPLAQPSPGEREERGGHREVPDHGRHHRPGGHRRERRRRSRGAPSRRGSTSRARCHRRRWASPYSSAWTTRAVPTPPGRSAKRSMPSTIERNWSSSANALAAAPTSRVTSSWFGSGRMARYRSEGEHQPVEHRHRRRRGASPAASTPGRRGPGRAAPARAAG